MGCAAATRSDRDQTAQRWRSPVTAPGLPGDYHFGVDMSIRTLNEIFFTVVDRNNDRVMLTREGEAWQPISSAQLRGWVYSAARQLKAWNVGKGDRVVILSENRREWAIADY